MTNPLVSVIVRTYNRAGIIRRAMDSIIAQTYPNIEIIVVDDGSTDWTAREMLHYQDKNLLYLLHRVNLGSQMAANTGFDNATGDYIAFLDSDDEWLPESIEKRLAEFTKNPALGMVHLRMADKTPIYGNCYRTALDKGYINGPPNMLFSRACVKKIGYFDPFQYLEDQDYSFRVARQFEIGFVDEVLTTVHHDQCGQMCHNDLRTAEGWGELLSKWGDEIKREAGESAFQRHYATACAVLHRAFPAWDDEATMRPFLLRMPA